MIEVKAVDVRQFVYCPRIIYFIYVMPVQKAATFKMTHGKNAEKTASRFTDKTFLKRFGIDATSWEYHKLIRSKRLGLTGRPDLLIKTPESVCPADFKFTEGGLRKNHICQITAYSLILEDIYDVSVDKGFVYMLSSRMISRVDIRPELKKDVLSMLDSIRSIICGEKMPDKPAKASKCRDCEYSSYCGDTF